MASSKANWLTAVFTAFAAVAAAYLGWEALTEYKKTNRIDARGLLYGAEREIAHREHQNDVLSSIYAVVDAKDAESYIRQRLAVTLYSDPDHVLADGIPVTHARDLYQYIWGAKTFNSEEARKLRNIYLHCEAYIYHMHNAYDLTDEGYISPTEWETWKTLIADTGPHPACLAAVYSAEKSRYFSHGFALVYRDSFKTDKLYANVIQKFYPEMLSTKWVDQFPDY